GTVDPNRADRRLQRAGRDLAEGGLAGPARPDDAEDLARLHPQAHSEENRPAVASAKADVLELEQPGRSWKRGIRPWLRSCLEDSRKPAHGGPRRGERCPCPDDALDRLERSAEQDRRCDDCAGRNVARDRKQGSKAQGRGLDEQPEKAAGGSQPASGKLRVERIDERIAPMIELAEHHRLDHSERLDRASVDRRRLLGVMRCRHPRACDLHPRLRRSLIQPCQSDQEGRSDNGKQSDPEVEQEGGKQKHGTPGCVEHGRDDGRSDRAANRVEIPHRLTGGDRICSHRLTQDLGGEQCIELLARTEQKAVAKHVEHRKRAERKNQRQSDKQQSELAPRWHDPVIDLKHVNGRGEIEDVDEQAEDGSSHEVLLALAQRAGKRLGNLNASNFHAIAQSPKHTGRATPRACPAVLPLSPETFVTWLTRRRNARLNFSTAGKLQPPHRSPRSGLQRQRAGRGGLSGWSGRRRAQTNRASVLRLDACQSERVCLSHAISARGSVVAPGGSVRRAADNASRRPSRSRATCTRPRFSNDSLISSWWLS